jgi:Uma2 family endonuclease
MKVKTPAIKPSSEHRARMAYLSSFREPLCTYGLHSGDRMTREEFHRIYRSTPDDFKAELVGGIVYVSSPLKIQHSENHLPLGGVFHSYATSTPGVKAGDNGTIILGDDAEPQPDLYLRILPEFGGQSGVSSDGYVKGAPELLTEIALSSYSIDLHKKREDYARYGGLEYLVLSLRERKLRWFDLVNDRELKIAPDGICRVHSFPGLWIHVAAMLKDDQKRLMRTLKRGLASPEHTVFVARLAAAQRKLRKRK